jgi:hypothetical protein
MQQLVFSNQFRQMRILQFGATVLSKDLERTKDALCRLEWMLLFIHQV